jgi:hypothetical protein
MNADKSVEYRTAEDELRFGHLSAASLGGYSTSWKFWAQLCRVNGRSIYPQAGRHFEFENLLISFLLSERVGQGLAPSTVASRVYAINRLLISWRCGNLLL